MEVRIAREMIWLSVMLVSIAFDRLIAGNEFQNNLSAEDYLINELFSNYSVATRPVNDSSESVNVHLYMTINQLIDVDERYQIITTRVWLHQQWNDTRLKWNPEQYGGLNTIVVTMDTIWTPDTSLLNSADSEFGGFPRMYLPDLTAVITSAGTVIQSIPAILRTPCTMDITYFPVDTQICYIRFGLWMYVNRQVQLILKRDNVPKENFVPNSEWDIIGTRGRAAISPFLLINNEPCTDVTFDITIKRKPLYYAANLIIPCVLVNFLTVVVFSLPSDSTEKVNLSISLLLTLYVFSLLVAELLPPTSNMVPMLTAYLIFSMMLIAVSVSMTTLVAMVCQNSTGRRHVPHWVKVVFYRGIAKIIFVDVDKKFFRCMSPRAKLKRCQKFNNVYDAFEGETSFIALRERAREEAEIQHTLGLVHSHVSAIKTHWKRNPVKNSSHHFQTNSKQGMYWRKQIRQMRNCFTTGLEQKTAKMSKYLSVFLQHLVPNEERIEIQEEWKLLVAIIDRLLLLFFAACSSLGATIMLSKIT
ncbi:neuronal acetylcholine receptor subunit beta-4-like [Saccoglossus kowalevskii]|uniref:Neuronal acetylcholine receptor subunit beta-4-like n=1 Tax=Saccoglossus kowalevskii TaxID=10224 RepID=A0ABM0LVD4_SACKO|nr:PREDICTED: neuronal acetylcholine receptor subunit beta-4-like [Saccoglossus kowalevskii]